MDEDIVYSPKKYRETEGIKVITQKLFGNLNLLKI
jgi:hypothetical protein